MWIQKEIIIPQKPRGFNLITTEVLRQVPEIKNFKRGIFHLFIQHTSASLTINENADPSVRKDMESFFNQTVPENSSYFMHNTEGSDDMPAHLKSSLLGASLSIPITDGMLNLGTWQGIYLCEHRNYGGTRTMVATIMGE
ncbi:MAG: secondary thiamine-phosphate synthase enzyme YjbQ [Bacteroidota bacterium]|nr:secondary thiamine-phosphate synthase enzyme YjbQ [Bacteroidota bacterium]MDP4195162.1 secondary thiamine-phosphate synthase enzyme YjbQ [Bacteroidota bacterium]